jgi:phosphoserine phosphatase
LAAAPWYSFFMKHACLALSLIAALLLAGPAAARAESAAEVGEAAQKLADALTKFGVAVVSGAIKELSAAAREHIDADAWHGPAIEADENVGGFKLRLYPEGKSRSDEHFQAETYYRLDQNGQLKEFEFSTTRKDK